MSESHEPVPPRTARVIEVIETTLELRGVSRREQLAGATARRITQHWSLDGQLLAEVDRYSSSSETPS